MLAGAARAQLLHYEPREDVARQDIVAEHAATAEVCGERFGNEGPTRCCGYLKTGVRGKPSEGTRLAVGVDGGVITRRMDAGERPGNEQARDKGDVFLLAPRFEARDYALEAFGAAVGMNVADDFDQLWPDGVDLGVAQNSSSRIGDVICGAFPEAVEQILFTPGGESGGDCRNGQAICWQPLAHEAIAWIPEASEKSERFGIEHSRGLRGWSDICHRCWRPACRPRRNLSAQPGPCRHHRLVGEFVRILVDDGFKTQGAKSGAIEDVKSLSLAFLHNHVLGGPQGTAVVEHSTCPMRPEVLLVR